MIKKNSSAVILPGKCCFGAVNAAMKAAPMLDMLEVLHFSLTLFCEKKYAN
ncbi:hypothetical protein [Nitrosomonas supralitoralis]|uniref:hypothetical protein n=1 Tax=Nitrosomonas supralitoralis TaxID=2116706 RepID=UPI001559758A|nr:hypothetical protein [Nitrosomonas supralitoralis]